MKFDFHTHHDRCGHAVQSIRDYIESAISNNLDIIGISDHSPHLYSEEDHLYPGISMAKSHFPEYAEEVLQLKKEYEGRIEVLLGVESDFFPEHLAQYKKFYEQFPLDYIIGSVHFVDGASIFKKDRWEGLSTAQKQQTKENYYQMIGQSARSGVFQILGHIDAMKGYYPEFSAIQTDAADRTLQIIAEADVAIEINTSGKNKYCGGWYPSHELLERALHHGVKVTFGSDAHKPERVGDDFEEVRGNLKEIGFKEWAIFRQKQRIMVPL
ncbi:histidinol-phosphatase HisJ family protein [Bacillus mangrovi]|uniref:Histidinol-phosphatase n=1 Tax=Metabacillus mangrovi TaxID=1491830 RepID=A0A7X2S682_9BACI|nr:histidinol-phosphatase [Metabacillus mangrovi]MTH54010.1 histidinol-phosphatase HisJ family protein [Metabacillus mangrovi]